MEKSGMKLPSSNNIQIVKNHKEYEELEGVRHCSLSHLIYSLNEETLLTIDIETKPKKKFEWYDLAGLDPHTSDIVSIQIGNDEQVWVID
jgi:hypothetical protein